MSTWCPAMTTLMENSTCKKGSSIDDDQILNTWIFYLQDIIHNNFLFNRKLFLYSNLHLCKYITKEMQIDHENLYTFNFGYFKKKSVWNFSYGVLLELSRCCFHHLGDNSILLKKTCGVRERYKKITWKLKG